MLRSSGGWGFVSLDELISTLEELVDTMESYRPEIATGKFVYVKHTNVFIDFCTKMVEACKAIYEEFKKRTGKALPNVEEWIDMAEVRVGLMEKRKFGDLVLTRDHNLIIDALKPIELALKRMANELGVTL